MWIYRHFDRVFSNALKRWGCGYLRDRRRAGRLCAPYIFQSGIPDAGPPIWRSLPRFSVGFGSTDNNRVTMSINRKPLSKKTRFDVFKRDAFTCQYCGSVPPAVVLEVDHIKPVCVGGSDDKENLITACFDCNRGKGADGLHVAPETIERRAEILAEKHEQLKAYERLIKSRRRCENKLIDEVEDAFRIHFPGYSFSPKFRESVRVFLKSLPGDMVVASMHLACTRIGRRDDSVKYFCGICWKNIKDASRGSP